MKSSERMIEKIRLHSNMSVDDVKEEIYSVFKQPNQHDFPFLYLQPTGCGCSLTIPALSPLFEWTVQEVVKLGKELSK